MNNQHRPAPPLAFTAAARTVYVSAWRDFQRAWGALVVYEVMFKLLQAWLFVPVVALFLSAALSRAGHVAVSNRDVFDFLLSPVGLLYAVLFTSVAVATFLLEQAGLMVLAAPTHSAERLPLRRHLVAALGKSLRVAQLGNVMALLFGLSFLPFVLLAGLTYVALLSGYDIYFYWTERPPLFWAAAGIGVVLLLAATAIGLALYVRWVFALPILLFEKRYARAALRASRERGRGAGWRVGFVVLAWPVGVLLAGATLEAAFRFGAAAALTRAGERPLGLILFLLVAQAALLASLSFVFVVGLSLVTRQLYLFQSEPLSAGERESEGETKDASSPWPRRLAYLAFIFLLLTPLALWADLPRQLKARPPVYVTAHRGHSHAAPENTLSAVRKAIESGADYAEIDVQQTKDGVVVLLHDRDFMRVSGDSRRIEDLTYDEARNLDVGSWFDPAFADERVPTLAEVIHRCRGQIKLNIEMKFFGQDRSLAANVARLVRDLDFEDDCLVTSLNYDALREVKHHNPRLRVGLIVAFALGDLSRLELDALSVRADFLSDELLREAHRLGMEVHAWPVGDRRLMIQVIQRGVDTVITGDPDMAVRVRNERAELTGSERLLLASGWLLGL